MGLENLSGLELGTIVNRKQISPVEVIKYFADRIEKRNPSINAFVYTKIDEALEEAKFQEQAIMKGNQLGPFAGVPIGLKDFLPTKKGWKASHGGVRSMITIDQEDSIFYKTAHALGAIAVGKTNAPSFGFRGTTDNKMYGPTSTPFKVGFNSGGSSGGSAAAVADGLVPIAETGDGGGSTRVPCSWCSCFGFKPSAGLVPSVIRPDAWVATHPYCCGGYATRTVADSALLIEAAQCYDLKDPLSVPLEKKNLYHASTQSISGLKIGYTYNFDLFPFPDKEIGRSIQKAVNILSSEGAVVQPVSFDFCHTLQEIEESWLLGISIDTGIEFTLDIIKTGEDFLADHSEDLPREMIYWTHKAQRATMMDYYKFHKIRTDILDAHVHAFEDCDVIIAPVTGCLPVKNSCDFDTTGPDVINGQKVDPLIGFAYTYLENMTGYPAASVPISVSEEGLPIGLQVIAPRYRDELVYQIAGVLERVNPWSYTAAYNRM